MAFHSFWGVDGRWYDIYGLCEAAGNGRLENVKEHLQNGVDVNGRDLKLGTTPLHRATEGGHLRIVEFLLSNGANVNSTDKDYDTPLNRALKGGHPQVVQLLLSKGAMYNIKGLCDAAGDGRLKDVKKHLQNGVFVNGRWFNWTPLKRAAVGGHSNIIEYLLSVGAKSDTREIYNIDGLCEAAGNGRLEDVKEHLQNGVNVNGKNKNGDTPLNRATQNGRSKVIEFLLSKGGKGDMYNIYGLCNAAGDGRLEDVNEHLQNGVDVNGRDGDNETPLYKAASHHHMEIIELLLSEGAQVDDIVQSKRKSSLVTAYMKWAFRNFEETKKSTMVALQKCITKAKNQKGRVKVKFIKILFTGSGKAGKTSFSNLLMKNKFINFHHSTKIVQAKHAVSVKKAVVVGSHQSDDESVVWVEMSNDSQVSHLRQILLSLDISSLQKTKQLKSSSSLSRLPQPSNTTFTKSRTASQSNIIQDVEASIKKEYVIHQSTSVVQWITGWFQGPVRSENMESFDIFVQNSMESNILKHDTDYHGEILNIITLLDTGGQPEYIHLLPTVNIHPMVNFVIHDLSKNLKDQVLVEYSEHGELVFEPYHLTYSNFDMIKFLMSSINDSLERTSSLVPQLVTIPGNDNRSYLCCVGTHADKVGKDTIRNADSQLTALVRKLHCRAAVWENRGGGVLFPVDNTTAGNDSAEDPIAKFIRNKIDKLAADRDVYELPITWMLFELEIRQVCSRNNEAFISFEECCSIAHQTNLISGKEEVRNALIYHHLLGVLLYYPDVPGLHNYVIIDHQWLFDRISNLVCLTFKQSSNLLAADKLKYNGILTKELIQELKWKEKIKEEHFIALLVVMKIIAPIQREDGNGKDYFIPYILPTYTIQPQCDDILSQYGCLQGEPFLIQFESNLLPRGFFCCLAVQILQQLPTGWDHVLHQKHTYHNYSNLITFRSQNLYYLSLMDKLSFLEVQIRHKEMDYYNHFPIHIEVMSILNKALKNICDQLTFNHERLRYGFHCQCGEYDVEHVAAHAKTPPFRFAQCRHGSITSTKLRRGHIVWLLEESRIREDIPNMVPGWDPEAAKKVYKEFRMKLLTSLPMNDTIFLGLLRNLDLFPGDLEEQVQIRGTRAEKTDWFLSHAIEPSLDIDIMEPLHKLLTVMSDDEYLKSKSLRELAAKVQQKLDEETSLLSSHSIATPPDPAGEDSETNTQ